MRFIEGGFKFQVQRVMTRAVRNKSGHPHEEKTSKLGMSITSLFHFHDDGKTNKSIVMPEVARI